MATPVYVPIDPNAPSGPVQSPDLYSASDLANVRAMRDMLVSGLGLDGWTFGQSPANTSIPTYYAWSHAATGRIIYAAMTYAAAPWYQPLTLQFVYSADGGASQANIGPVVNFTFDAATGTVNSTSGMAGLFELFMVNRARSVWNWMTILQHTSGADGAHGIGSLALQNANNVNITGGVVGNVFLDDSGIRWVQRIYPINPPTLVSGAVWNWGVNGVQCHIAPGATIPNISNPIAGEVKRLFVQGGGPITIGSGGGVNFFWCSGSPVWSAVNGTLISLVCVHSTSVIATTSPVA